MIAAKAPPCPHPAAPYVARPRGPVPYVARPRRTASPSAARAGGRAQSSTIRTIVMLALSLRGLVEVVDGLEAPWRRLAEALVLTLLALAFLAAAARSADRRLGWLLSASATIGLALAAGYSFASTAGTAPVAATGAVVLLGIVLMAAYGRARAR